MDLPTLIASLFDGIETGVLVPILEGLSGLTPFVLFIAIVLAILALIFAERTATKVGSLVTLAIIAYLWPHIPDLVSALLDYNLAAVGADAASNAAGGAAAAPDVSGAPSLEDMQGA